MIKFPGIRKGTDAARFLTLAGFTLPEMDGYAYTYTRHGVVVEAVGLQLSKGKNVLVLPSPAISDNVLLLLTPSRELEEAGLVYSPVSFFDRETLSRGAPTFTLTMKEAMEYTGPVAKYYVMSDK